jgi:transcriptional regulator with XRE-family HTH domain
LKSRKKTDFSREIVAFGEAVRALRQELGLTIEQLAELADLSNNHVSDIERARTNPRVDTIDALAAALGVSMRALVDAGLGDPRGLGAKGIEFAARFDSLPLELQADVMLLLRLLASRRDPP